jgi:hypothetical protein
MTKRNHEINSRPGAGHSTFPDTAQVTATQTVKTVPAGTGVYKVVAAALTGDIDIPVHRALQVIDVWIVKTAAGGAGDTITVKNDATAITDAIDGNAVDKTIVRAGTIDDAQAIIPAGGTLTVSGASAETSDVFILVAYLTD